MSVQRSNELETGARSTLNPLTRLSRTQVAWIVGGLGTAIVVSVLAQGNLLSLYSKEPDFMLGSLLSVAGFCFAKAFSRSAEQRAIQMITTAPTKESAAAIEQEFQSRLHRRAVYQLISLLARNVTAASERGVEYYYAQARTPDFFTNVNLLKIVLDDLEKASANVAILARALDTPDVKQLYSLSGSARYKLYAVARYLNEAVARRNEVAERYAELIPPGDDAWGVFKVMTIDMLKAEREVEALLGQYVTSPPADRSIVISSYIDAAFNRQREFADLIRARKLDESQVLRILHQDLSNALEAFDGIDFGAPLLTASAQ